MAHRVKYLTPGGLKPCLDAECQPLVTVARTLPDGSTAECVHGTVWQLMRAEEYRGGSWIVLDDRRSFPDPPPRP